MVKEKMTIHRIQMTEGKRQIIRKRTSNPCYSH